MACGTASAEGSGAWEEAGSERWTDDARDAGHQNDQDGQDGQDGQDWAGYMAFRAVARTRQVLGASRVEREAAAEQRPWLRHCREQRKGELDTTRNTTERRQSLTAQTNRPLGARESPQRRVAGRVPMPR
jgi:hypothetical protein